MGMPLATRSSTVRTRVSSTSVGTSPVSTAATTCSGLRVHLVVGTHHCPRLAGLDHPLEGRQVDLPQGALVDLGVDPEPVGLLVVGGVVLHRGADTAGLDAVDDADGEFAGQVRILGEVLEVPSAQR